MEQHQESAAITHGLKVVSTMLDMTERRIKSYEQVSGNLPQRIQRGGVSVRAFTPSNIFDIAAHKRTTGEAVTLEAPITCTVFLPKGGVGKSSLATELSIQFQLMGLRVLLIDLDPQASSTFIFGLDPEAEVETAEKYGFTKDEIVTNTFADLLDFKEIHGSKPSVPFFDVVKKPYGENGPHLIPADVSLSSLTYSLYQANNRDYKFASLFKRGRSNPDSNLDLTKYDVILFDSAPSTSVVSRAALVASDYCISPIRLDALSAKSISFIASELNGLIDSQLPCPQVIAVPTFFSFNTQRSNVITQALWENYADYMIHSRVRTSEVFPKSLLMASPRERMPVSLRHPAHPVVREDLLSVSKEIIARIQQKAPQ
jgi:chromosome partitioning protein